MRCPANSIERLPQSRDLGEALRQLLESAVEKFPSLLHTARAILGGDKEIPEFGNEELNSLRSAARTLLKPQEPTPQKSARANSPLDAELIWGWGDLGDDPDAKTLATWVQQGAPLGFDEPITTTGVFPILTGTPADTPTEAELRRPWEEWTNWPSAEEEQEALVKLVREAEAKGFCKVVITRPRQNVTWVRIQFSTSSAWSSSIKERTRRRRPGSYGTSGKAKSTKSVTLRKESRYQDCWTW